ncbi:MAG TPA: ATP-binding protein [bacterium]|nr:ATP-binding protein [bacterium]HPS29231.1 ATP-binding protein [bacterium]
MKEKKINNILPDILKKYRNTDFGTQLKVQFAYYLSFALFLLTIPIIINSIYVFSNYHELVDFSIIIVEFLAALIFLFSAIIIIKGYYRTASHIIFISSFLGLWYVVWVDRTELIMKLNTVEYVLALLSMIPVFFERKTAVIVYTAFNFALFAAFIFFSGITIDGRLIDFIITTSIAMLFISIVALNISRIKKLTLQKVYSEIKKLRLAEEALLAEKEKLFVTIQSIGDGVITTGVDGKVVLINSVAENLTGWNQSEAEGKLLSEVFNIINEISGVRCENPVEKVLNSGMIQELANHTMLIARNGTKRIIADSGAPIKDRAGNILGVVLVFRDMTEKQKLIDTVQQTQKLQAIGTLAGGIAHDFNNLLTGVFGFIGFAKDESKEQPVKDMLVQAESTIDRARSLTRQLLTFSKGGFPIKKIQHFSPFIEDTVRFALSGSSIAPVFDIQADLHDAEFDRDQIAQVIDNVVINAVQAMPDGGNLEVTAQNTIIGEKEHFPLPAGNYVKISIKDYGTGIAKNVISNIFDPFFTTKTGGHGLGLAMCYSIMNKHNGVIEVESEEGSGSTFYIFIPAIRSENPL